MGFSLGITDNIQLIKQHKYKRIVRHLLSAHGLVYHAKAHVESRFSEATRKRHSSLAHPLDTPIAHELPSSQPPHYSLSSSAAMAAKTNQPLPPPVRPSDFSATESLPPSSDICYTAEFVYSAHSLAARKKHNHKSHHPRCVEGMIVSDESKVTSQTP